MTKYAPEQLGLPFGEPSEMAVLIRSIDYRVTELSEHAWRQVRELLIAVAYCGGIAAGCNATRETLLRVVNDNSDGQVEPLSLRTLERRHLDAVQLGLLLIERRYKRSALRRLDREQIAKLVAASRKLQQQNRAAACAKPSGGSVADQWRISGGSTGGSITYVTNTNLSKPNLSGRRSTTKKTKETIDEATARRAVRVWRELQGTHEHWRWLVKCFALAGSQLSEHWLQDALEGVRRSQPRDRWALLWSLLERGSQAEGRSLRGLLSAIQIPEALARPRLRRPDERLCSAGEA